MGRLEFRLGKGNIDHTFRLKRTVSRYRGPGNWQAMGRGTQPWFCWDALSRLVGPVPRDVKRLFMRISTEKPDDKEVQWWHISVRCGQPLRSYYWDPIPDHHRYFYSPNADNPTPGCELPDCTSDWACLHLNLKDRERIKLWLGCWVEE